ncbi:35628_t:CDS:2, partial [Racocetra persica]
SLSKLILSPYLSKHLETEAALYITQEINHINKYMQGNPLLVKKLSKALNPLEPIDFYHGYLIYYLDNDLYITDNIDENDESLTPYIYNYKIVPELTSHNNKYLIITNQGGDRVILDEENSIANEVEEDIFEQFPEAFEDSKISLIGVILQYLKKKKIFS